jgi:hypothetical protein
VDEPTAGLDPEERLRFYRLLSELAAERVVLLSTHIVEDVAQLCPRFAIIRNGRLVANTTPEEARQPIEGSIFEASVGGALYQVLVSDTRVCVTQDYRVGGENRVRVYQPDGATPPGFIPMPGTLDDAYFVAIKTGGLPSPGSQRRGQIVAHSTAEAGSSWKQADGRQVARGGVS